MDHSLMEMRDRFTQMEIRQVELEQQLHTLQSAQTTVQPTTRSKNGERDMSALWTLLRELQDKEETRRAEMSQLNEVVQKLMEEVRKLSCNKQPARGPSTSPEETLPQQQVDDSPNTSAETEQLPSTPPYHPNNTTTRCPEDTPTSNEETQNPQIVLLIDSNGRYIEEKKLFPKHRVAKLRCRNTQHALELLTEDKLGSPSHIIIHTGTNDLRRLAEHGHPTQTHVQRPPLHPDRPLAPEDPSLQKDPFPPDHITTSRPPTTHTPWSHQPRPTPLLPTPPHTYSQAVSRGNIPSRDRSIHGMLSELYTFLIQN
ncbi:unnamed protein product [Boreogadus saida]